MAIEFIPQIIRVESLIVYASLSVSNTVSVLYSNDITLTELSFQ